MGGKLSAAGLSPIADAEDSAKYGGGGGGNIITESPGETQHLVEDRRVINGGKLPGAK